MKRPSSGPPTKPRALTPDVRETIIRSIRLGSYLSVALRLAGVSRGTWRYWRARVKAGDPAAIGEYAAFYWAAEVASARAEIEAISALREGGPDWRAKARFLERRYPARWGWAARAGRTVNGELDDLDIDLTSLSDAELEAMAAKYGAAGRIQTGADDSPRPAEA